MMPAASDLKIVTANDLLTGDVVYLTPDGGWSREIAQAEVLAGADLAAARLSAAAAQPGLVVGAYLADVAATARGPAPVHFREEFRAKGPSNYAHGKQVEQNNV
jgi:hypothetical protein